MAGTRPFVVPLLSALLVAVGAGAAHASGIATARYGAEKGHPTAPNPTALYFNPAAVGFASGTHAMLDVTFAQRNASYTRPESAIDDRDAFSGQKREAAIAANSGTGTVNNQLWAPMAGITTDFGTDLPFSVGFAFHVPFGGQSVWAESEPNETFPGAVDGPQRWYAIEGTIRTLAFTWGGAYRIEPIRLSFGASVSLYKSEIDTVRARNPSGRDDLETDGGREGRTRLDVDSLDWGIGLGAMWEPIEHELWIGASWQSRPNMDGDMLLTGRIQNVLGAAQIVSESSHATTQQLPSIFRLGFRYRPIEQLELRLFGDLTRWSVFDRHCIHDAQNVEDTQRVCTFEPDGSARHEDARSDITQNLRRNWKDAGGVRAGASWFVAPEWELIAGVGYDANAVPDSTLEPALMDAHKMTGALGVSWQATRFLRATLTATNVFYVDRDTTGAGTAETLEGKSRQPSSEGIYEQNLFLLNSNVEFTF